MKGVVLLDVLEDRVAKEVGQMILRYTRSIDLDEVARRVDEGNRRALDRIRVALDRKLGGGAWDDFLCVEEIVQILESIGTDGGCRHDF